MTRSKGKCEAGKKKRSRFEQVGIREHSQNYKHETGMCECDLCKVNTRRARLREGMGEWAYVRCEEGEIKGLGEME